MAGSKRITVLDKALGVAEEDVKKIGKPPTGKRRKR